MFNYLLTYANNDDIINIPSLEQCELVKTIKITKLGGIRYTNDLILYLSSQYPNGSGANQYGYEVAIDKNNLVVSTGVTVIMPKGGMILSGHGSSSDELMTNVKVGQIVKVDLDNECVSIYENELFSKYYKTVIKIKKAEEAINEVKIQMYDCNLTKMNAFFQDAKKHMNLLNEAYFDYQDNPNLDLLDIINQQILFIDQITKDIIYSSFPNFLIEARAIWHRPNSASQYGYDETNYFGVQKLVEQASKMGIQTILIETLWEGYTIYPSQIVPFQPSLMNDGEMPWYGHEYGSDYLKCLIGEAKKRNISIHAWTETFLAGVEGIDQPLASHIKNSWLTPDYFGRTVMPDNLIYLDPVNPEVRLMLRDFYSELASNYDLDGIEIDYIRYPYSNLFSYKGNDINQLVDSGYSEVAINDFLEKYNYQGDLKELIKTSKKVRNDWTMYRSNQVTEVVSLLHHQIKKIRPDIIISTAVAADYQSGINNYAQNWQEWVKNGWIEIIKPMAYTPDTEYVGNLTKTYVDLVSSMAYIYTGIGPVYLNYPVFINQAQMATSVINGAMGSAIFVGYNIFGNEDFEFALTLSAEYLPRLSPYDKPDILLKEMSKYIIGKINRIYNQNENFKEQKIILPLITKLKDLPAESIQDFEKIIIQIENILSQVNKINNPIIKARMSEDLTYLFRLFNVLISRELINTNQWDPMKEPIRPTTIVKDSNNSLLFWSLAGLGVVIIAFFFIIKKYKSASRKNF